MSSVEHYARKLRLLTNTIMNIDELEQKHQLLLDELHRVDAQLSKHKAFLLKLEVEIDEIDTE